jgi:hypothetical protein
VVRETPGEGRLCYRTVIDGSAVDCLLSMTPAQQPVSGQTVRPACRKVPNREDVFLMLYDPGHVGRLDFTP